MYALLGGCACCDRRDALAELLRDLCAARHSGAGPRRAVLETSGLADPAGVLHAIEADPVLSSNVVVADVVIVVDAERGLSDLVHEQLARVQLEQADSVIVSKTDLVDAAALATVAATVTALNPGAAIRAATFGDLRPMGSFDGAAAVSLPATTDLSAPRSRWIPVPRTVDWTVLTLWLGALVTAHPQQILRIKGLVRTPAGPVILHAARGAIGVPTRRRDADVTDDDCGLLVLVRDLDPDAVAESWNVHRRALSADP
ncbi:GTP-binding protein [Gordonia desulfuricans]|uniref:GTP-binding protein n=2 Tax=Gordonia desulfuricans TaxID=89051 RepID=A0A7K3LVB5_9ACTN|nr:GTP-binding protein [Gordonia desulfuricans]